MKHRGHLLVCLFMLVAYGLGYVFVPSIRELGWFGLIILACPLMHVFGLGEHSHSAKNEDHHH